MTIPGYAGRLLRVDLSSGRTWTEELDESTLRFWVGGVALGAKVLFEEVRPGVAWDQPDNRLIVTTGPVAGSGFSGAATINVMAKGPMTNLAGASQANGFMGAYMKFSGFDGMIFQGVSPVPVYLHMKDGQAALKDASHLTGLDVMQVEDRIRADMGCKEHDVSVFAIGPAGERRVRFAAIAGDRGHVAGHNGLGAVMGAKNLKAFVAHHGKRRFQLADAEGLKKINHENFEFMKNFGPFYQWGTGGGFSTVYAQGALPVRNYTTNLFPEHERMNGQYLRTHFEIRSKPCYRCRLAHVKEVTVTEGPYAGFTGEEPEYEQLSAWGPQIGNTDLGATVMLANEVDRLGLDCNEAAWCVGWAMECYGKGIFTRKETDGLDLSWGNAEAARELLNRIARREGFLGDLLAEGVMRASWRIGGETVNWAVHTMKGSSPRGHDHRGRWSELFDSCTSNTSTIESSFGGFHTGLVDMPEIKDAFDPLEVASTCARFNGIRMFDDCVGVCRLAAFHPKKVLEAFNAVTGWDFTLEDAFTVGLRAVNVLRIFNLRHGMRVEDERPSTRYGSVPVNGPAAGKDIMARWPEMLRVYYAGMGWDEETGRPLPDTLARLRIRRFLGE